MSRVVITGYSAVTAAGGSADESWQAIKAGRSGLAPIQLWDLSAWDHQLAGEIKQYDPREMVPDRKLLKVISRHDVIGIHAVTQALQHSGLLEYRESLSDPTDFNDRTGLLVGSPGVMFSQQYDFMPLMSKTQNDLAAYGRQLLDEVHPMWLLRILPNNVLAYASILYGFKGANENFTNHVVSGSQAVAEAWYLLKQGIIDRAIVIGYDAGLDPLTMAYYAGVGLISKTGVRPFTNDRDGCVLAEGAGVMLLETEDFALQRGATIYGEILAGATFGDATGILSIGEEGEAVKQALQHTLKRSQQTPESIGMITAHANATQSSDRSEANAIRTVFGENSKIPVTAFKWALGHTLAGAGVIETIMTLLALREQVVPGIATLNTIADDCRPLAVSADPQSCLSDTAIVITRGFAGLTACLAIKSC